MVDHNAENRLFEAAKKLITETASGLGLSSIELDDSGYALIEMEHGLSVEINLELDDSSALQLDFNLGLAKAGAGHERLFYELLTANAQWEATRGGSSSSMTKPVQFTCFTPSTLSMTTAMTCANMRNRWSRRHSTG